ncbi:MAG: HDOD domain-containing protein [Deltaproteobacteria bacterium]|nr:HDOD domain-containing protein [Deltaproteobacteria bacterium]MBW2016880.1 HDOD domain-containing protein [Deltaproteobacteria bacterium]MBW2128132.1 HDOD domain-containing protein [Deltaproteobacteria bacterium]MBW2304579.1 HDOD domain-containing protein [Deltaproteobacteria bacterium]
MDIYVARQPIFKRNRRILGYELLFREDMSNFFPDVDQDSATSNLLSNSFFTIGIEKITGRKLAFINFTEKLIIKRVPLLFPRERIVVEVLENVRPSVEVIDACDEVKKKGYEIALDDFFFNVGLIPLVEKADIIKLDFKAMDAKELAESVKNLSSFPVRFLAEKVETYEEFNQALKMGFQYFQGYFFSRPEIIRGFEVSSPKMSLIEIMAEANKRDFDFGRLERLISRDVTVSYKLLRYINSAYYRRLTEISSIHQALVLLGERRIRRFLALMAMTNLASEKPHELIRASIIRASFCEALGEISAGNVQPSELFTLGLFSLIDAIMDDDMAVLMEKLPLSGGIKKALVAGKGPLADYLELVKAYEMGNWPLVEEKAEALGIGEDRLPQEYLKALGFGDFFATL